MTEPSLMIFRNPAGALALAMIASPVPALAHHSFAMFDTTRLTSVEGTVKEFQWTNPHSVVWVDVAPPAGGAPVVWALEMASPANLTRMGWNKRALKAGDRVRFEVNPLRDGQPGGSLRKATILATGQVLTTQTLTGAVFGDNAK